MTTPTRQAPGFRNEPAWTPRQREVLDLLVRNRTNSQIAETLGISLDGAKWHVSEIITKLGVESRDEAAEYWRERNGLRMRFTRALHGLFSAGGAKVAGGIATTAVVGAAVVVALFVILNRGEGSDRTGVTPPTDGFVRRVLSDGQRGYSYRAQVAYVDPAGVAWLSDADGKNRVKLLEGCTGVGSAKRGDVSLGGLAWSPTGAAVSCWRDDLSALAVKADGSNPSQPLAADQCSHPGPQWAPGEDFIGCSGYGVVIQPPFAPQAQATGIPARMQAFAWAPSGKLLIGEGDPLPDRIQWAVFDTAGNTVTAIPDAFIGEPARFAWTRDGGRLAYPGIAGVTIIDFANDAARTVYPWADIAPGLDSAAAVHWVLGDTSLLVEHANGSTILNVANGETRQLPGRYIDAIAPNGKTAWFVAEAPGTIPPGTTPQSGWLPTPGAGTVGTSRAAFLDLETGALRIVAGSDYSPRGIGMGPSVIFSGDSSRACWTWLPGNDVSVQCADVAGGDAFTVVPPVQVEPDVLGYGDLSVLWRGFSPDLKRIAYTVAEGSGFTLHTAGLDGKDDVVIGPALSQFPHAWRADGVYREPLRQ